MDSAAYWDRQKCPLVCFKAGGRTPHLMAPLANHCPPSTIELTLGEWPQWDIAKSLVLPLLRIAHVAHVC